MTGIDVSLGRFDEWLSDDSPYAALVLRQWLVPVEGRDAVVFPPTYARPDGVHDEDWTGYNIDRLDDGTRVCLIDSVGSQANRMEPIFKRERYKHLVPQVTVNARVVTNGQARDVSIHLLDAGHRAADAIVRFSTLGPRFHEAFRAFQQDGSAERLARIAPTSIVFGCWDSRATQAKLPRVVRSVIRAFDIELLHRSAQYSTIAGEILEAGEAEVTTKGPKAELGLAHVPAVMTHGGIKVKGEIRRDALLNLVALRALGSDSHEPQDDTSLRRYILGLALVAFTAPQETFLREGCQLVPLADRDSEWTLVSHDGGRYDMKVTHEDALAFATAAAKAFRVDPGEAADFDADLARKVLALNEAKRKALLRQGPVTREAVVRMSTARPRGGRGNSASTG